MSSIGARECVGLRSSSRAITGNSSPIVEPFQGLKFPISLFRANCYCIFLSREPNLRATLLLNSYFSSPFAKVSALPSQNVATSSVTRTTPISPPHHTMLGEMTPNQTIQDNGLTLNLQQDSPAVGCGHAAHHAASAPAPTATAPGTVAPTLFPAPFPRQTGTASFMPTPVQSPIPPMNDRGDAYDSHVAADRLLRDLPDVDPTLATNSCIGAKRTSDDLDEIQEGEIVEEARPAKRVSSSPMRDIKATTKKKQGQQQTKAKIAVARPAAAPAPAKPQPGASKRQRKVRQENVQKSYDSYKPEPSEQGRLRDERSSVRLAHLSLFQSSPQTQHIDFTYSIFYRSVPPPPPPPRHPRDLPRDPLPFEFPMRIPPRGPTPAEFHALQDDLHHFRRQCRLLESELGAKDDEIGRLRYEIERIDGSFGNAMARKDEEIRKLDKAREEREERVRELSAQLNVAVRQRDDARNDAQFQRRAAEAATTSEADLKDQIDRHKLAIKSFNDKYRGLVDGKLKERLEIEALRSQVANLQAECEKTNRLSSQKDLEIAKFQEAWLAECEKSGKLEQTLSGIVGLVRVAGASVAGRNSSEGSPSIESGEEDEAMSEEKKGKVKIVVKEEGKEEEGDEEEGLIREYQYR